MVLIVLSIIFDFYFTQKRRSFNSSTKYIFVTLCCRIRIGIRKLGGRIESTCCISAHFLKNYTTCVRINQNIASYTSCKLFFFIKRAVDVLSTDFQSLANCIVKDTNAIIMTKFCGCT